MPELPDVTVYVERLDAMVSGRVLQAVRLISPFVLRSVDPPLSAVHGKRVRGASRLGKRVVIELEDDLYAIIHLMIAGRLRWRNAGAKPPGKAGLAAFDFEHGTLLFTEAGSKKRASLHVVRGHRGVAQHDPGGIDVFSASAGQFASALTSTNHTLKRALTSPRLLDGIGNAYSDEILHRAGLSPLQRTQNLSPDDLTALHEVTKQVLTEWINRTREEVGDGFPDKVTAFRESMAVHGRFGQPCPVCDSPVQRIVYASTEVNYCATCQTGGKLLADRAFSRLLREDWPRTLEEWEDTGIKPAATSDPKRR